MARRRKKKTSPRKTQSFWPVFWRRACKVVVYGLAAMLLLSVAYRWVPVPITPLMAWRMLQGYGWQQNWVGLENLPPHIGRAVLATEDNRFCEHKGVDWQAVEKVYNEWKNGGGLRGASTISMQTAKNVYLWPNQDVVRKALEIPLTYMIETLWGKQRILEVYLNIAEWGPGVYGIEAAARYHFNVKARQLSPLQAAYLAAILPAPLKWSPTDMPIPILLRAEGISTRVAQLGPQLACIE